MSDSIDDALVASISGIRALKISLVVLGATALVQLAVTAMTGSVALFADSVHNLSDALTALPLWVAFRMAQRPPSLRFTHGLGRVEDLAGLFILVVIAASAVLAAVESLRRLADPQPVQGLGLVALAGLVGFAGNEWVAHYRISVGRRIGSAALVADGVHARTDGLTSLAVVLGAALVAAGFPAADPIVGLVIAALILVLLVGTARTLLGRMLEGVDPELVVAARAAAGSVAPVLSVGDPELRWLGHRLHVDVPVVVDSCLSMSEGAALVVEVEDAVRRRLPAVGHVHVHLLAGEPCCVVCTRRTAQRRLAGLEQSGRSPAAEPRDGVASAHDRGDPPHPAVTVGDYQPTPVVGPGQGGHSGTD